MKQNQYSQSSRKSTSAPPKKSGKKTDVGRPAQSPQKRSKISDNVKANRSQSVPKSNKRNGLKVMFLGGVGEIGKNMTVFEYNNQIVIVDAGLAFPSLLIKSILLESIL